MVPAATRHDGPVRVPTATAEYRAKDSAAHAAGVQLSRATLGYVTVITAIITLAPFRFASVPQHGLTDLWTTSDIIMNIVMFMPLGFLFALTQRALDGTDTHARARAWTLVVVLGALLSAAIETAQLFEAERYTSLFDVVTNALGALVGFMLHALVAQRVRASSAVRSLALELPLMGLIYLMMPLMWLAGLAADNDARAWLILPLSAVAGGILGSVHAGYVTGARRRNFWWLAGATLAWYAIAILPSAVRDLPIVAAGAVVAVGCAMLRSIATKRARDRGTSAQGRRFELPTLRLVLPLFAAYVALSSLWPLDGAVADWYAGFALMPPGMSTSTTNVFLSLEHVAVFTLVGYVIAEFHGRALFPYVRMMPRVILWGGGISLLLELTRGFHPQYRASVSMMILTVAASTFGGWMYHLQRDHVRALNDAARVQRTSHEIA